MTGPGALWRAAFGAPWWSSGVLYAHVDGLREFPVATVREVHTFGAGPGVNVHGYLGDLHTGAATTRWHNPYTGEVAALPHRLREGPLHYRLDGDELALTAAGVRVNRAVLTCRADGQVTRLTQVEGTLQGFPGPDGPDGRITERQTRTEVVVPRSGPAVAGFRTQVYDELPAWLGFGDRLGGVVIKSTMRRDDPLAAARVRELFR